MRAIRKQLKFVNVILSITLLISLFFLIYNVYFSENNYKLIYKLRDSIHKLDKQIVLEKEKYKELEKLYLQLNYNRNETIENFIRSYLFMVKPDEAIILKKEN